MTADHDKETVLFLCSGNACRSQMAEGFLRTYAGHAFEVYSAGLAPAETIHPMAVQVMKEVGIDISRQRPKGVRPYLGKLAVHHLIIVCEKAARNCPTLWPGALSRNEWPFEDPQDFKGDATETLAKFREIRDHIDARLRTWLAGQAVPHGPA